MWCCCRIGKCSAGLCFIIIGFTIVISLSKIVLQFQSQFHQLVTVLLYLQSQKQCPVFIAYKILVANTILGSQKNGGGLGLVSARISVVNVGPNMTYEMLK